MLYRKITSEIICVGQIVLDCITRNPSASPKRKNVYTADSISLNPGGDALNEATVLTRLGRKVRLMGVTGTDYAGSLLRSCAQNNGIDTDLIRQDDNIATPVASLIVREKGRRESFNSDASMLGAYVPDPEKVTDARILSLASLFRAPLDRPQAVADLVGRAKKQDMIVSADTKLPTFRQMNPEDLSEILPMIDYIFPNENEAAWMTGRKEYYDMAEALADMGVRNVIIKAGESGSYVRSHSGDRFHVKAIPVNAIDSTGAGDSFVAGFLSALLEGKDLLECCHYGTACSSVCVQNQGAVSDRMKKETVDEVFSKYYGG